MAKLDRLRVQIRVFGRNARSPSVYVGTFTAWLPQVPAIGWVLDTSQLDEVDWVESTNESFTTVITAKEVTPGDSLVVQRIALDLDDDGSCNAVSVDAMLEATR